MITRLRTVISREIRYLREDAAKVRARVTFDLTPQRKAAAFLVSGAVSITYGLATWAPPVAWVIGGALLIVGGFVLVDLDPPARRRRRTAAARRKAS